MSLDDAAHRLRNEVAEDETIEATFRRLRQEGHSRLEVVQMILDVLDVSLSEAKTLLLRTDTWAEAWGTTVEPRTPDSDKDASSEPIPPAPG